MTNAFLLCKITQAIENAAKCECCICVVSERAQSTEGNNLERSPIDF